MVIRRNTASITGNTVVEHIEAASLVEIRFVVFTPDDHAIYRSQLDRACAVCWQGLPGIRDCLNHHALSIMSTKGPRRMTTTAVVSLT